MTTAVAWTGPGDARDQRWLDERIEAIDDGVQAVIDIARNWTEGRCVSRLHPGVSAAEYVTSHVGTLGKSVVPVLLAGSDWSNRQIAAVAGVHHDTVDRAAKELAENRQFERPAATLGSDGKYRPARVVREVKAEIVEAEPETPARPQSKVIMQAFERDAQRLLDGYLPHLDDERFAARFGAALAALDAALRG